MTASAGALAASVPEMADTIPAYAATSNMLTGIDGVYAEVFLALPFVNWLYNKIGRAKEATSNGFRYTKDFQPANHNVIGWRNDLNRTARWDMVSLS